MRATVEHIGTDEDLPPLSVRLVRGCEDLSIKVLLISAGFSLDQVILDPFGSDQ